MAAPMKKTPVYLAPINLAVHFVKGFFFFLSIYRKKSCGFSCKVGRYLHVGDTSQVSIFRLT